MTNSDDVFKRAAKRFLVDLASERGAAAVEVSTDENKGKEDLIVELGDDRLGGDRFREAVDLLEADRSGEDVVEMTQEKEVPEKAIVTIQVDGEPREVTVYRYPNGSMKDAATGRWLAPPSPNTFEDPKKARDAVTKRHERVLEQARAGLVRGVNRSGGHEVKTSAEAWAAIVEEQTVLAMGDKRGSTASARLVGSATKMISEDKQVDVQVRAAVAVVSLDAILMGMFNRLHPDDPQRALSEMRKYKAEL